MVKLDKGVPDGPMNIGEQVVAGIVIQPQQPSEAVRWQQFDSVEAATTAIADNQLFAAIILPEDYSAKLVYALLLMMVGFLGATVVNGLVDAKLGFGPTEMGPKRRMLPPRRITRVGTYSAKCLTLAVASVPAATAVLAASVFVVDLDLPHCGLLWLFSLLAINAIGAGTLAVVTSLGPIGIVVSMVFFIGWSIPAAGGPPSTTPAS
ncbi:hypothetical protein IU450_35490 [Nocardia abscessus]|uniref:hypothetical protein n=1 Tax=Nocardia abscessus TaxID=120957 RepID=UPI0018947234|nr:hypothetical protein [Nocardia abscessus]MBF6341150.1 hypothetical protein [Nocardia abscessus]